MSLKTILSALWLRGYVLSTVDRQAYCNVAPHSPYAGKADCPSEWPVNHMGLEDMEVEETEPSEEKKEPRKTKEAPKSQPRKVTPSPEPIKSHPPSPVRKS